MKDIRLVASDLDGTLMQYGKKTIGGEIFEQIRALAAHGIRFCPASGRQYTSLRALFAPVAEDCVFICENGAAVFEKEKIVAKTPMPRALAEEIAWDFWNRSDGEVMLSGENTSYLMGRGRGTLERVRAIGNNCRAIGRPAEVPEEIIKVSACFREGVGPYVDRFIPRWKDANAAVAGPEWIDTTSANKGVGIAGVCRALEISPAQVMAFGDNYNDVPMLDTVGFPYIMDGAAPELRARYPRHTPCPEDVLRELLEGLT